MQTFQQIIQTLQHYWADHGCALLQPYDIEVGAGTSHTATFLRARGPEPWRAAYVQPSRRPKDGRYGDNPNRLQHFYQFQVVLKPAPADILELYLGSLEALGCESVYDLVWTEGLSYRVVYHQNEVEQSTYNFEHSDVDFLLTAFGAHEM